jgi:hypothetical protein
MSAVLKFEMWALFSWGETLDCFYNITGSYGRKWNKATMKAHRLKEKMCLESTNKKHQKYHEYNKTFRKTEK